MKKVLIYFTFISTLFTLPAFSTPAHFIAWGDEEGTVKRPGDDLNDKNEALPVLMKKIQEIDKVNKIDAILHVGDFVRFDPNQKYYQDFLGSYLEKFYPTSGGDQEFYFARYWNFITNTPHLKKLYLERVEKDKNGLEFYYNTIVSNIHIISLYSPDEYREPDRTPQYKGQNFFLVKNPQYIWLENLLEEIRVKNKDERPIIILCHGPIFNFSKNLLDLFEKNKVNLVLNGDAHILAHKEYKGTHYFVSGMMGDRAIGGCDSVNDPKDNPDFISNYDICIPEKGIFRKKGEKFTFYNDHYLDIYIDKNYLKVDAINLETNKKILSLFEDNSLVNKTKHLF